jgi:phospholipid/cholesterol/gamma-HCH transport system substrate-binding protein
VSSRTKVQLRRYGRDFAILVLLMIVGTATGFYILLQQRLPNPLQTFYSVNASFPTVAAVAPGLGEPVNVAGVHVGQITGASLKDGQGILHMSIDPSELPRMYNDARAQLVPNTALKDMQVNITPGTPAAGVLRHGGTIPLSQTTSPIDSDELLAVLDTDTRTWLTSLITDIDRGITGRGHDLRRLFANLTPTATQLRRLTSLVAARRGEVASIVHNLGVLTSSVSSRDGQLRTVVRAGARTLQALASQDAALRDAIVRLPGTLQTTRTTLADVATLSDSLGPTATALLPTARRLPSVLRDARTLFEGAALLPLKEIPPFVQSVLPLARRLPAITTALDAGIGPLRKSFEVLAYTTNETAYNGGHNPGFLYWLAWAAHNADSLTSMSDAHGAVLRGQALISCGTLQGSVFGQLAKSVLGIGAGC